MEKDACFMCFALHVLFSVEQMNMNRLIVKRYIDADTVKLINEFSNRTLPLGLGEDCGSV